MRDMNPCLVMFDVTLNYDFFPQNLHLFCDRHLFHAPSMAWFKPSAIVTMLLSHDVYLYQSVTPMNAAEYF